MWLVSKELRKFVVPKVKDRVHLCYRCYMRRNVGAYKTSFSAVKVQQNSDNPNCVLIDYSVLYDSKSHIRVKYYVGFHWCGTQNFGEKNECSRTALLKAHDSGIGDVLYTRGFSTEYSSCLRRQQWEASKILYYLKSSTPAVCSIIWTEIRVDTLLNLCAHDWIFY